MIKHSEETKRKISEATKGEKNPFYGKKHSEETRKHWSEIRTGNYGRPCSEETKKKISESKLGEKNPMWKGDDAGYKALHYWVKRNVPPPEDGLCEMCHQVPFHDATNISGKYIRIKTDWKYACRKCHMESDGRLAKLLSYRQPFKRITNPYDDVDDDDDVIKMESYPCDYE